MFRSPVAALLEILGLFLVEKMSDLHTGFRVLSASLAFLGRVLMSLSV